MALLFDTNVESQQDYIPTTKSAVEWSTPRSVFAPLNAEFGFTVDVCASHGNAKCERFYTRSDDGLQQDWSGETVWMNPPYARKVIDAWMRKAYEASQGGATVVCLVPASTSCAWWHDYAMCGEVRFVRGRIRFGGATDMAMFSSVIIVFRPPSTSDGPQPCGRLKSISDCVGSSPEVSTLRVTRHRWPGLETGSLDSVSVSVRT